MQTALRSFVTYLIDLMMPPRESAYLVRALTFEELSALADHEGMLPYREPRVRALIWELKYRRNAQAAALARAFLHERLMGVCEEELGRPLLIPLPMHKNRRRERGFNQTEVLCESARSGLSVDYAPEALERIRLTPPQQELPRVERLKNVRGSMRAREMVRGRSCIVLDDVTTTGATLEEARRALREAGAASVHLIALAH